MSFKGVTPVRHKDNTFVRPNGRKDSGSVGSFLGNKSSQKIDGFDIHDY
jgi:hypothetical protein